VQCNAVQSAKKKPLQNSGMSQSQSGRGLREGGKWRGGQPEAMQAALLRYLTLKNAARIGFTAAPQTGRKIDKP